MEVLGMGLPDGFINDWTRAENGVMDAIADTGARLATGEFPDPIRKGVLCGWSVSGQAVTLFFQDGIRFTYPRSDYRKALVDVRAVGGVTVTRLLEGAESLSDLCDVFCSPIGTGVPRSAIPARWTAGDFVPVAKAGEYTGVEYTAVAWDDRQILVDIGDALVIVYREGVEG